MLKLQQIWHFPLFSLLPVLFTIPPPPPYDRRHRARVSPCPSLPLHPQPDFSSSVLQPMPTDATALRAKPSRRRPLHLFSHHLHRRRPPDSWETADLDGAMSCLLHFARRVNYSLDLATRCSRMIASPSALSVLTFPAFANHLRTPLQLIPATGFRSNARAHLNKSLMAGQMKKP